MSSVVASSSITSLKNNLRRDIKLVLKSLSNEYIENASVKCVEHIVESAVFKQSAVISIFVSMPTEVQTKFLIEHSFRLNKRVFIPKVLGKASEDMKMVEMKSLDEIVNLPKNSWGIGEPVDDCKDEKLSSSSESHLVVVPGVAFDARGHRLGHGRGYYGTAHCRIPCIFPFNTPL